MALLKEKSKLYMELTQKYEQAYKEDGKDIDFELYNDCVDVACRYGSKREIKYILFQLRCLYDDLDTGIEKVNKVEKIVKCLAGNSYKASFMISVLETALEEMP